VIAAERQTFVIPHCPYCGKAASCAVPAGTPILLCCPKCKARKQFVVNR